MHSHVGCFLYVGSCCFESLKGKIRFFFGEDQSKVRLHNACPFIETLEGYLNFQQDQFQKDTQKFLFIGMEEHFIGGVPILWNQTFFYVRDEESSSISLSVR